MKLMLRVVLAVLVVGVIGLMIHCNSDGDSGGDQQGMVIRTYEVPEGFSASEWAKSLNSALHVNAENKVGRVRVGPSDTLIVTAQKGAMPGVEQLIESFRNQEPRNAQEADSAPSVTVHYWVIVGRATDYLGPKVELSSSSLKRQKGLLPVLQQITESQGAMEFFLLEQLSLTSLNAHQPSRVSGKITSISQHIVNLGNGINAADVQIRLHSPHGNPHDIQSRIKFTQDQYIILGQTAYDHENHKILDGINPSDDLMLYYVISSEID